MSKDIRKIVNQFIKQQKLAVISYSALKNAAVNMGYTIIEFNNIFNDKDVETVIQNLNLSDTILRSRGFTYVSKDYRLIFICEDLNEEEKLILLSHEIGHIVCEHFMTAPVIGKDVKEEHEANEFSHYLLNQNTFSNLKLAIIKHKKSVVLVASSLVVMLVIVVAGIAINKEQSYYGDFYITTTGNKYHQPECIHVKNNNNIERLTKDQLESGNYEPCGTCLP